MNLHQIINLRSRFAPYLDLPKHDRNLLSGKPGVLGRGTDANIEHSRRLTENLGLNSDFAEAFRRFHNGPLYDKFPFPSITRLSSLLLKALKSDKVNLVVISKSRRSSDFYFPLEFPLIANWKGREVKRVIPIGGGEFCLEENTEYIIGGKPLFVRDECLYFLPFKVKQID